MPKKIDSNSDNNKKVNNKLLSMPKKSSNAKPPTPKKRGRHPKKVLDDVNDIEDVSGIESIDSADGLDVDSSTSTHSVSTTSGSSDSNESSDSSESPNESKKKKKPTKSIPKREKSSSTNKKEISSVICKLNIDPKQLAKFNKKGIIPPPPAKKSVKKAKSSPKAKSKSKSKNASVSDSETDTDSDSKSESNSDLDGIFDNDIPRDSICSKCVKNEKIIGILKTKLDKCNLSGIDVGSAGPTSKIHKIDINLISHTSGKKITLKKVSAKCFWDTNTFDCLPMYLVESYHGGEYRIREREPCCCINCALAHNLYFIRDSKVGQRRALTIKLYREMHAIDPNTPLDIREAGPRGMLKDYLGTDTIETYRKKNCLCKEYITYVPPIRPIIMLIEEKTTNINVDTTKKKYILKRSKPLTKKKSIISTMNIAYDDDE